jgi:hypothetical protein
MEFLRPAGQFPCRFGQRFDNVLPESQAAQQIPDGCGITNPVRAHRQPPGLRDVSRHYF